MNPWVDSLGIQITFSVCQPDFGAITAANSLHWRDSAQGSIPIPESIQALSLLSLRYLHFRPPGFWRPQMITGSHKHTPRGFDALSLSSRKREGLDILQARTFWCASLPRWVHSSQFIPQQSNFEVSEIRVDDLRELYFSSLASLLGIDSSHSPPPGKLTSWFRISRAGECLGMGTFHFQPWVGGPDEEGTGAPLFL